MKTNHFADSFHGVFILTIRKYDFKTVLKVGSIKLYMGTRDNLQKTRSGRPTPLVVYVIFKEETQPRESKATFEIAMLYIFTR